MTKTPSIEEMIKHLNDFGKRNDISVYFVICEDGSWALHEFWSDAMLYNSDGASDMITYLKEM